MDERIVVVARVSKRFGGLAALAGVDLTFARGGIVALLGASGAGETKMLAGGLSSPGELPPGTAHAGARRHSGMD